MKRTGEIDQVEATDTIARWIEPIKAKLAEQITTEASRLELCQAIHEAIRTGARSLDEAVAAARMGDPYVDRVLRHIARDWLTTEQTMPSVLRTFVADALFTEAPPSFPAGQHAYNLRNRNAAIRALVDGAVERWGLSATRNTATDSPCACSLVADALARFGIQLSEGQVQKSYKASP